MDAEVKNEEGEISSLIEPKQEIEESVELIEPKLIEEENVKKEEIDDSEYQHIIPHEYRDYLKQNAGEEQPTNSRKRPAEDRSMPEKESSKCQKCGIVATYVKNARSHALRHTDLKMFQCPAAQCGYKAYENKSVSVHMRQLHKSCTAPVRKVEMSDEERQVLRDMMHECFPHLSARDVICQLCHQSVNEEDKIEHSNGHIDPLLHVSRNHCKVFTLNDRKLQLTREQMMIRKWNNMCFGDSLNEDPIDIVDYPAPIPIQKISRRQNKEFCQCCKKEVTEANCWSQEKRRNHALEHVDIMLYKCSVPDCQVQTKDQNAMIDHEVKIHDLLVAYSGKCKIPLTTAQMDEVDRMFIQCFPVSSKK